MEDKNEIIRNPREPEGMLAAVLASFLAGAAAVLGLLKIISKE